MPNFKKHLKHDFAYSKAIFGGGDISFSRRPLSLFVSAGLLLIFASVGTYLLISSRAASTLTADFNSDGVVNVTDLSVLATNWGRTSATHAQGDANSDGTINIYDLSILASQWGQVISSGQPPNSINIKDYGATGDGVTNDVSAFNSALAQAHQTGKTLYVPAGSFLLSSQVLVPDGVNIIGTGESSWLMGPIKYGSNETWTNLRIGARFAAAARNSDGAHDTTFQTVRFSGGGGQNGSNGSSNVGFGGPDGSLTNISFTDCKFDATFTQPNGDTTGDNVISIGEEDTSHVQNLSFTRCIIGSSNGTRTGSPRMGIEALSRSPDHYLSGLQIIDSTFEPTDETALDIESSPDAPPMTDMLIQGNLIKGGNPSFASPQYQQSICLEIGGGVQILNNTIWGSKWAAIEVYDRSGGLYPSHVTIANNTIDATQGVPPAQWAVHLDASQVTFTGNTMRYNGDQIYGISIEAGSGNVVTGNSLTHVGGSSDTAIVEINGASGNNISGNSVSP